MHCVKNASGANFRPELNQVSLDAIFRKGEHYHTDSYSVFNNQYTQNNLKRWIKTRHIERFTILGMTTDYCVKFSVIDAMHLGYTTEIITDGCCDVNLQLKDSINAIKEMKQNGANLLTLNDFITRLTHNTN